MSRGRGGPTIDRENSRQDWATPREFIHAVQALLHMRFEFDLAADADNAITPNFFSMERSAFSHVWPRNSWSWLNPPYTNLRPWAKKAWEESQQGSYVTMLVPASAGTNWWDEWVHGKAHVLFIRPRLKFIGADDLYPKDLALLIYKPWATTCAFPLCPGYSTWNWNGAEGE